MRIFDADRVHVDRSRSLIRFRGYQIQRVTWARRGARARGVARRGCGRVELLYNDTARAWLENPSEYRRMVPVLANPGFAARICTWYVEISHVTLRT